MKLNIAGATLVIFCLLYTAFAPAVADDSHEDSDEDQGSCGDWTQRGRLCLKFFREPRTWSEAEGTCVSLGRDAHLVSIHSAGDQKAVDNLGRPYVNSRDSKYWIGAIGNKKEPGAGNTYTWVNGKPLDFKNWGTGEPNNGGHNEHCLSNDHSKGSNGGGRWNDDLCHTRLPFVCSYRREQ